MEITILNHTDKKDGVHWQFGQDIQIVILRPKCQTKFSEYAGNPYSIGISVNVEIYLLHRTDVFISAWKPYII